MTDFHLKQKYMIDLTAYASEKLLNLCATICVLKKKNWQECVLIDALKKEKMCTCW
jgi:hypothetical protein